MVADEAAAIWQSQGLPANFSVGATGTPVAVYQWYRQGIAIPGATGSVLTVENVQSGSTGRYSAVISDAQGTTTSAEAVLTMIPAPFVRQVGSYYLVR